MANRQPNSGLSVRMSLLVLLALLAAPLLQAKQIDIENATSIAEDFFSSKFKGKNGKAIKAKSINPSKGMSNLSAEPAYYVFAPEDAQGFVIVSAEDQAAPIVGYSLNSNFDPEHMPDGLKAYLSDYSMVVKAISDGKIQYKTSSRGGVAVNPLLTVEWNQDLPYNLLAPVIRDNQAPTGCVATAIAQVMKYYEFPQKGNGTVSSNYGTTELGGEYDWANMLDSYTEGNYTQEQADAVALLMRDVGYSVEMEYGYSASSASSAVIAGALCRNFNYSPDIRYRFRSNFSTQAWIDEIRENLLSSQPVLYGGASANGKSGHEFVCDGIDSDDMLHINWGWGGYGNGYFDVNILEPNNLGIGAGDGAYYAEQDMVVNIRPGDPNADYLPIILPITISEVRVDSSTDGTGKLLNSYNMGVNVTFHNSTGSAFESNTYMLGLALKNASDEFLGIYGINSTVSIPNGYYITYYYSLPCAELVQKGVLSDGKYSVSVVCIPYNSDFNHKPTADEILPLSYGDLNNINFSMKDGELYLDDPGISKYSSLGNVKIINGGSVGNLYAGMNKINLSLSLKNTGSYLVNKESFEIHLVPDTEDYDAITDEYLTSSHSYSAGYISVYLYPGVTQEVQNELYVNQLKAGKYRLFATYFNSGEGCYKLMEIENPIDIELLELPENTLLITKPIVNYWPETAREQAPWINIEFNCYNTMNNFASAFQIWCRKKGEDESKEFLIFKEENKRYISQGDNKIELWGRGEYGALWFEELGTEWEASLKYIDPDGNLKPVAGNNSYQFTLVEDENNEYFHITSPMVINGGNPVKAEYGVSFDVEFEFQVKNALRLYTDDGRIEITKDYKDFNNSFDSFYLANLDFDKTELNAGEKAKVKATFVYYGNIYQDDISGTMLYVLPKHLYAYEGDDIYPFPVQIMPYLESTRFMFGDTEPTPTLVESLSISPTSWNGVEGESFQLTAEVLPENATDKTLNYSSSDVTVADVNQDGLVSVLTPGNCRIIVSTVDGSNLTAECIITSTSGIDEIFSDNDSSWNVYDMSGALLKKDCDKNGLKLLSPGIYILRNGKKTMKLVIR